MRGIYTSAAWTANGGVQPASQAVIEVRRESDGELAEIWDSRTGGSQIDNPSAFGDKFGRFQFFAAGGAYRVKITQGTASHELRYQSIGTAKEFDSEAFILTQDHPLTVSVGPGQDFSTLNAALAHLSARRPLYQWPNAITARIVLSSDYVMEEQVVVVGQDLSWVEIVPAWLVESTTPFETTIARDSLTANVLDDLYGDTSFAAFACLRGGNLPIVRQMFRMSGDGASTNRDAFVAAGGGVMSIYPANEANPSGCNDAARHAIYSIQGCTINAPEFSAEAAGANCIQVNGGRLFAERLSLTGSETVGNRAIYCINSDMRVRDSVIEGFQSHGLHSRDTGNIDIRGSKIRNNGGNGLFAGSDTIIIAGSSPANQTEITGNGEAGALAFSGTVAFTSITDHNIVKNNGVGEDLAVIAGGIIRAQNTETTNGFIEPLLERYVPSIDDVSGVSTFNKITGDIASSNGTVYTSHFTRTFSGLGDGVIPAEEVMTTATHDVNHFISLGGLSPLDVTLTPLNDASMDFKWRVSIVDDSTFRVHATPAPTTESPFTFKWEANHSGIGVD